MLGFDTIFLVKITQPAASTKPNPKFDPDNSGERSER